MARGAAPTHAAILEHEDLFFRASAQVAARQAGNGPAHGLVRATEMQQVLLGLVRGHQHDASFGQRPLAAWGYAEQTLERVNPGAGAAPIIGAVPAERALHGFGHAPAVREAELGEHRARGRHAEVLHQVLSQQPHGYGVDQQRSLAGEANHARLGIQLQKLFVVQIFGSHWRSSFYLSGSLLHIDGPRLARARGRRFVRRRRRHGTCSEPRP
jgi:hypothetical protein